MKQKKETKDSEKKKPTDFEKKVKKLKKKAKFFDGFDVVFWIVGWIPVIGDAISNGLGNVIDIYMLICYVKTFGPIGWVPFLLECTDLIGVIPVIGDLIGALEIIPFWLLLLPWMTQQADGGSFMKGGLFLKKNRDYEDEDWDEEEDWDDEYDSWDEEEDWQEEDLPPTSAKNIANIGGIPIPDKTLGLLKKHFENWQNLNESERNEKQATLISALANDLMNL